MLQMTLWIYLSHWSNQPTHIYSDHCDNEHNLQMCAEDLQCHLINSRPELALRMRPDTDRAWTARKYPRSIVMDDSRSRNVTQNVRPDFPSMMFTDEHFLHALNSNVVHYDRKPSSILGPTPPCEANATSLIKVLTHVTISKELTRKYHPR